LMFDDDNIALWVGTNPGEIIRVGDLQRRIAKYAVIPEVVRLRLEQDRARRPDLTPLQQEMKALINIWAAAGESAEG